MGTYSSNGYEGPVYPKRSVLPVFDEPYRASTCGPSSPQIHRLSEVFKSDKPAANPHLSTFNLLDLKRGSSVWCFEGRSTKRFLCCPWWAASCCKGISPVEKSKPGLFTSCYIHPLGHGSFPSMPKGVGKDGHSRTSLFGSIMPVIRATIRL